MKVDTRKFDPILETSPKYGHVNQAPNGNTETPINTAQRSMPFADQLGNYQRNIGLYCSWWSRNGYDL